jgi:hypothetical protein
VAEGRAQSMAPLISNSWISTSNNTSWISTSKQFLEEARAAQARGLVEMLSMIWAYTNSLPVFCFVRSLLRTRARLEGGFVHADCQLVTVGSRAPFSWFEVQLVY